MSEAPFSKSPDAESRRVVLRECGDLIEAETIRIRLAVEGIDAFVTGTDAGVALSMGGAGTDRLVRVEVPEHDVRFAYDLLEEDRRRLIEAGPWICGRCREQNEAAFELCWKCQKQRDETDERGRLDEPSVPPIAFADDDKPISATPNSTPNHDTNPYRPVLRSADHRLVPDVEVRFRASEEIHDEVMRAFRASVVGILVLPPVVTLYSLALLLRTGTSDALRDRTLRGWWIAALCIDAIVMIGVFEFVRSLYVN